MDLLPLWPKATTSSNATRSSRWSRRHWCLFACHSPTAMALGSSAIVKVSGKNCFRTLYGSVGQIRLGQLKGSAEGSTKILPRFHQGCTSFVVSLVFWASSSWAAKRFYGRFHQGCTEVPPRFHQGSTKVPARVHQGSSSFVVSLVLIRLGCQKVLWKVPSSLL